MMMIIITRYPASEDRLIVRPLLSRVCALRLQPAEPQPYSYHAPRPKPGPEAAPKRSSSGGTVRQALIYGTSPRCASWMAT